MHQILYNYFRLVDPEAERNDFNDAQSMTAWRRPNTIGQTHRTDANIRWSDPDCSLAMICTICNLQKDSRYDQKRLTNRFNRNYIICP